MKSVSQIDIAKLAVMQFATKEVLPTNTQTAERKHQLHWAMLLNYGEHQAVNICFQNRKGDVLEIECAVIAVTDDHVMLKSGIILPVQSIISIELL